MWTFAKCVPKSGISYIYEGMMEPTRRHRVSRQAVTAYRDWDTDNRRQEEQDTTRATPISVMQPRKEECIGQAL